MGTVHSSLMFSPRRVPLKKWAYLLLIFNLMSPLGCSTHISSDKVPGVYRATYPFGKAVLVLQSDGAFVQTVEVNGESAVARGSWNFDSQRSKITLLGIMPIVDGFGQLERNWHNTDDLDEQPVERLWLKIEIETNESYGYAKQ